ncbi:MAG: tRNA methyl transferase PRC-barrel domain-containing protein, partial [Flavobacteriales bacterium]
GLATADKKDSQGLCFVGQISLPEFLQQKLATRKGKVIEIPNDLSLFGKYTSLPETDYIAQSKPYVYSEAMGKQVGEHQGAHFFTIGQRKGLNIGGTPRPLFVIGLDTEKNLIFTGQGEDHPGLYRKSLFIRKSEIHWIREDLKLAVGDSMETRVRIRYRQALEKARLIMEADGLYVLFDKPQKGVTPGQFAAWYVGEELLGSGVIHE